MPAATKKQLRENRNLRYTCIGTENQRIELTQRRIGKEIGGKAFDVK